MYVLNLESANVRKYEGGIVGDKEITVANVEDLANKVPGGKLLLELYNKRTGDSVKKFASRGQGLNRLWKAIADGSTISAASATKAAKATYVDKATSKKLEKQAARAAKSGGGTGKPAVVGTIKPAVTPRSGKLAGRKLVKKAETNPRRANTFGWRSWEAYKSGVTYEDALKAGARRVDIDWDIKHGYVEAVA